MKTELGLELTNFSDELMYFESGRQAMRAGIGAFDSRESDIVLMPASLLKGSLMKHLSPQLLDK